MKEIGIDTDAEGIPFLSLSICPSIGVSCDETGTILDISEIYVIMVSTNETNHPFMRETAMKTILTTAVLSAVFAAVIHVTVTVMVTSGDSNIAFLLN